MPHHRYTVVTDQYSQSLLDEFSVADPAIGRDIQSLFNDLYVAPHAAGVLKFSGCYIGRRGAIEIKYHVSDDDRMVRIIGVRRCAHPFDVVLAFPVRGWLTATHESLDSDLAINALKQWTSLLRRDPRLVGRRLEGSQYRDVIGRVSILFEINEPNSRVTILSIDVK